MGDDNSGEKFEKIVLDIWENEGGNLPTYEGKLTEFNLPSKDKQKKNRHRQAANENKNLQNLFTPFQSFTNTLQGKAP